MSKSTKSKIATPSANQKSLTSFFTKTPTTNKSSPSKPAFKLQSPAPVYDILSNSDDKENYSEPITTQQQNTKSPNKYIKQNDNKTNNAHSDSDSDTGFAPKRRAVRKSVSKVKRVVSDDDGSIYSDNNESSASSVDSSLQSSSSGTDVGSESDDSEPKRKTNKRQKTNNNKSVPVRKSTTPAIRKSINKTTAQHNDSDTIDLIENSDGADYDDEDEDTFRSTHSESHKYDFVKRGQRRDAYQRLESHPNYDPRTLYIPPDAYLELTPGEKQYFDFKKNNMDVILLYKMGKFYEIYDDDADACVAILGINYMGKQTRRHCGFPEQAYDKYADQLIKAGKRIARVEQVQTPRELEESNKASKGTTKAKKVVNRKLVSVTSRGTQRNLDNNDTNFVLTLYERQLYDDSQPNVKLGDYTTEYGITYFDRATGQFTVGQLKDDATCSRLRTVIAQLQPVEILYAKNNLSVITLQTITSNKPVDCELNMLLPPDGKVTSGYTYDVLHTVEQLNKKAYFVNDTENAIIPYTVPTITDDDNTITDKQYAGWPSTLVQLYTGKIPDCDGVLAMSAFGLVLSYLQRCVDDNILRLKNFRLFDLENIRSAGEICTVLELDGHTLGNLEILVNSDGNTTGTLFGHVDKCSTTFGRRLLREWLLQPLKSITHINERLDSVDELINSNNVQTTIRDTLSKLPDLDRLLQNIHQHGSIEDTDAVMYTNVGVKKIKDFCLVLDGFELCTKLIKKLKSTQQFNSKLLQRCIYEYPDITELLEFYLNSFDRVTALQTGTIIPKPGVMELYDAACQSERTLRQQIEQHLIEIKKLPGFKDAKYIHKINEPYQIEVPRTVKIPNEDFTFVSGTKNVVRYYTPYIRERIKPLELADDKKQKALKSTLQQLFAKFIQHYTVLKKCVSSIAELDCLLSLAITSQHQNTGNSVRPVFIPHSENNNKSMLEIRNGVHPVLCGSDDTVFDIKGESKHFIPNDTVIGCAENPAEFILLTGANMGGKSTILRQTCQIAILAQIGCYVPASSCRMTPIDRIFTRVGANDKIMAGQSTFMVELSETSIILKQATPHSLVILDELGRGTSTFDGTAIAYAVIKYLAEHKHCMTLFSTHYHMLIRDFIHHPNIALYKMSVASGENDILFMYKFVQGYVNESHGMHVAHMAELPETVIRVAREKADEMLANMNAVYDSDELIKSKDTLVQQYKLRVTQLYRQAQVAYQSGDMDRAAEFTAEIQRLVKTKHKYLP